MQSESEILDYYAYLGIPDTADQEEIKKVYKKCMKEHHPDRNPTQVEIATKTTQLITQINATLSNPEARAKYDKELKISRLKEQLKAQWSSIKIIPLLEAVVLEDVQAVRTALSLDTTHQCFTAIEYIVNNRKLMLNAIEIAVAIKRADILHLLFSFYGSSLDEYLDSDQCHVYEVAAECYQKEIFDYLRKGLDKRGPLIQLCRSSLKEEAVLAVLTYHSNRLTDLSILDALFHANKTEEKIRGIQKLIKKIDAYNFVTSLFKDFRNLKSSETEDRKLPDDLYLSQLKALNINLSNWRAHPGIIFKLIHSLPDTANYSSLLKSLIDFGIYPRHEDFLHAASKNLEALLSYLVHDTDSERPRLKKDNLEQIFLAVVRSKKRSTILPKLLEILHRRLPEVLLTVDTDGNNCLHLNLQYGNQDSMEDLSQFLMSKLTVDQGTTLYYGRNKASQCPKDYPKKQQLAAFLTWLNNSKAAPTDFFSPVVRKNPHVEFLRALKPYVDCIQNNDFLIFSDLIGKLTLEHLHNPEIGFCLLQKAVVGNRYLFLDLLIKSGCDVYLKHGNPLHRILYTWVNDSKIEQYLLRAEEKVNNVISGKRPAGEPSEPPSNVPKHYKNTVSN